jgi:hypothetical protein
MAYQVTVTDGLSSISWVVAQTSNARVALRWASHQRAKMAGTFADVGVWDVSREAWLVEEPGSEVPFGH